MRCGWSLLDDETDCRSLWTGYSFFPFLEFDRGLLCGFESDVSAQGLIADDQHHQVHLGRTRTRRGSQEVDPADHTGQESAGPVYRVGLVLA